MNLRGVFGGIWGVFEGDLSSPCHPGDSGGAPQNLERGRAAPPWPFDLFPNFLFHRKAAAGAKAWPRSRLDPATPSTPPPAGGGNPEIPQITLKSPPKLPPNPSKSPQKVPPNRLQNAPQNSLKSSLNPPKFPSKPPKSPKNSPKSPPPKSHQILPKHPFKFPPQIPSNPPQNPSKFPQIWGSFGGIWGGGVGEGVVPGPDPGRAIWGGGCAGFGVGGVPRVLPLDPTIPAGNSAGNGDNERGEGSGWARGGPRGGRGFEDSAGGSFFINVHSEFTPFWYNGEMKVQI